MYKVVQEYERKNKIIQQIQKTLTRGILKDHDEAEMKKVTSAHPTHFHLPNVYLRSEYSPRSSHKSLETKLSNLIFKEDKETNKKGERRQMPNWIKAINIKNKERSLENFLLANETNQSPLNPTKQERDESLSENKESIGKRFDFHNHSKILSQYKSLKKRQSESDSFSHNSFQIIENSYQSEWIQLQRKEKRRMTIEKRAESNMEGNNEHKNKHKSEEIRYYYAPEALNNKHKPKLIRVCSPWQSTNENQEEDELLQLEI